MMMMMKPALLSVALLLLLQLPDTLSQYGPVPIYIVVNNTVARTPPLTYTTQVVYRGILLGAMRTLMNSCSNFTFSYTEDPNYGPYLESVNGVAACKKKHTYWELLVKTPDNKIIRPDVGIGCYIPTANQTIILNFTEY